MEYICLWHQNQFDTKFAGHYEFIIVKRWISYQSVLQYRTILIHSKLLIDAPILNLTCFVVDTEKSYLSWIWTGNYYSAFLWNKEPHNCVFSFMEEFYHSPVVFNFKVKTDCGMSNISKPSQIDNVFIGLGHV